MRIRHVVNVVGASARPGLVREQDLTLETMDFARRTVPSDLQVEVVGVRFADEEPPADWLVDGWTLDRSVLDIADFAHPRRLPLLGDVLQPFQSDDYDLGIFTNIDIALQPRFYELVAQLHRSGHDAFVINRRTVQPRRPGTADAVWLAHQVGAPHPGHDCFAFTPEVVRNVDVGDACLGAPYVMRGFLYHLILAADRFRDFTDLHATFHLGDDREWSDPKHADYQGHNTRSLLHATSRLIERFGRDEVERLPGAHLLIRELEGGAPDRRSWHRPYDRRHLPHTFDRRRLIFAASPGRTGSQFLATVLDTCRGVTALHEPKPTMTGVHLRDVAYGSAADSYERRQVKVEAIRASLRRVGRGGTYCETSHMFVKTFADVVLAEFNHDRISIVHLHRPLEKVLASMVSLGWFTPITPVWRDWLIPPTAPGAAFRIEVDEITSQFDMAIGYVLDTEVRIRALRRATPDVRWVDLDVATGLVDDADARRFFRSLGIRPTAATDRIRHGAVNRRHDRKRVVGADHAVLETQDALVSFRSRFARQIESAHLDDLFADISIEGGPA